TRAGEMSMLIRRCIAVGLCILLSCTSLRAFLITVHIDLTKTGLASLETILPSTLVQGRGFTARAIKEIVNANLTRDTGDCANGQLGPSKDDVPAVPCGVPTNIDSDSSLVGELYSGGKMAELGYAPDHFDDELFLEGNDRLINIRNT